MFLFFSFNNVIKLLNGLGKYYICILINKRNINFVGWGLFCFVGEVGWYGVGFWRVL